MRPATSDARDLLIYSCSIRISAITTPTSFSIFFDAAGDLRQAPLFSNGAGDLSTALRWQLSSRCYHDRRLYTEQTSSKTLCKNPPPH